MPRYYFHVRSASGVEMDRLGLEFDTLDEAIADARQAGAELLLDEAVDDQHRPTRSTFEIADASGRVLAKVPIGR
ncbi:MAG TPA: hypothetical protein VNR51_13050 [Hyphomicrobium sp.]|nr:hypothetical protein [Hyphomicrobium sp.]